MKRLMNVAGLLLVVLLAAVVGVAVIATMREIKETTESIPVVGLPERLGQKEPISPETIVWETYTDSALGFSLKYPKGWFVEDSGGEVEITSLKKDEVFEGGDGHGVDPDYPLPEEWYWMWIVLASVERGPSIKIALQSFENLEEWAIAGIKEAPDGSEATIVSKEKILIDSIISLKIVHRSPSYREGVSVYVPTGKGVLQVFATPTASIYHQLLDEILESIDLK